jgi:hypothetical protein
MYKISIKNIIPLVFLVVDGKIRILTNSYFTAMDGLIYGCPHVAGV